MPKRHVLVKAPRTGASLESRLVLVAYPFDSAE